jgi:hypothetical protein
VGLSQGAFPALLPVLFPALLQCSSAVLPVLASTSRVPVQCWVAPTAGPSALPGTSRVPTPTAGPSAHSAAQCLAGLLSSGPGILGTGRAPVLIPVSPSASPSLEPILSRWRLQHRSSVSPGSGPSSSAKPQLVPTTAPALLPGASQCGPSSTPSSFQCCSVNGLAARPAAFPAPPGLSPTVEARMRPVKHLAHPQCSAAPVPPECWSSATPSTPECISQCDAERFSEQQSGSLAGVPSSSPVVDPVRHLAPGPVPAQYWPSASPSAVPSASPVLYLVRRR